MGIQALGLTWRGFCGRIGSLKKSLGFSKNDFLDNSCFSSPPVVKKSMKETEEEKAKFSVKLLQECGLVPPDDLMIAAGYEEEVERANKDTFVEGLKTGT